QFSQFVHNLERSCTLTCTVARQCVPKCPHQPLERNICGATGYCIITYVRETSRLEMSVDEAAQGTLSLLIHPRIDAMGYDVVESTEVCLDCVRKVRGMKFNIFDSTFRCKCPRVFDMRCHKVDAAKTSGRMCRGQN